MLRWLTCWVVLALAGCATGAEIESRNINETLAAHATAQKACQVRLRESPPYQALQDKFDGGLEVKVNPQKATPQEAAQVIELHREVTTCRNLDLFYARDVSGSFAAILKDSHIKADASYVALAGYRISWGQFATDMATISAERGARLSAEMARIRKGLTADHRAEMQRRQAAFDSVGTPTITNCTNVRGFINCVTY